MILRCNYKDITAFACMMYAISGHADTGDQLKNTEIIKLTTSDIRNFQHGDSISYRTSVAGNGSAMSGSMRQLIGQTITNPSGKKCTEQKISGHYEGIGRTTSIDTRLLYFQDNRNSLYECGFFDEKSSSYIFISDTANTPDGLALAIESPLKVGNTTSNLITYTDGSWKDCTRAVHSIENVVTDAGTFESYRITEDCSRDNRNSQTRTQIWFVPNIFTVKESGQGETIAGDFILESYSLD